MIFRWLFAIATLAAVGACFKAPEHPAVGEWHSTQRGYVLRLLSGGTGSFQSRSCTWQRIDDDSVETNCEEIMRDNSVRAFTVAMKDGVEVGTLESFTGLEFRRSSAAAEVDQGAAATGRTASCEAELEPTWVGRNEAVQALRGQVLIASFNTSEHYATLRITLPDNSVEVINSMPVGSRRLIAIQGGTYFLDLLDAGEVMGAQIALTCKQ